MQTSPDLVLRHGDMNMVEVRKCQIYNPSLTFSGVEIPFNFTLASNELSRGAQLGQMLVDVYLMGERSSYLFLGRLKEDHLLPMTNLNYARDRRQVLELDSQTFIKLIDETHYKDLEFKISVQAFLYLQNDVKNFSNAPIAKAGDIVIIGGEDYLRFPHSEWAKTLNATKTERFDLITLRTSLPKLPTESFVTQAFDKLKEAQTAFDRGNWNGVGSACRSAFRTILRLADGLEESIPWGSSSKSEKQPKAIQKLIAKVIEDPNRTNFASSLVPLLNILNETAHQEAKNGQPTANFQREDAFLCNHLTSVAISYIAIVHNE